jgi:hypothetical protein
VTSCTSLQIYGCFEWTLYFHVQSRSVGYYSTLTISQYGTPKVTTFLADLQGATPHQTVLFFKQISGFDIWNAWYLMHNVKQCEVRQKGDKPFGVINCSRPQSRYHVINQSTTSTYVPFHCSRFPSFKYSVTIAKQNQLMQNIIVYLFNLCL